jgi:YD repeat-containing protein
LSRTLKEFRHSHSQRSCRVSLDARTTHGYFATNQLTPADYATQTDETFGYDANGNRTTSSALPGSPNPAVYTTGDHNRITSDGTYNYAYDLEGNRISKTNIVTLEAVEYVWNPANLLTDVITRDGLGILTKTVSYRYDGLGRRIGKFVDDNGDTVIDRSETFIYDGAGLLSPLPRFGGSEGAAAIRIQGVNGALGQYGWVDNAVLIYADADGSGPASSILTSRNLYGPLVDQIFASEDSTGNVLWALTDQLGTPATGPTEILRPARPPSPCTPASRPSARSNRSPTVPVPRFHPPSFHLHPLPASSTTRMLSSTTSAPAGTTRCSENFSATIPCRLAQVMRMSAGMWGMVFPWQPTRLGWPRNRGTIEILQSETSQQGC